MTPVKRLQIWYEKQCNGDWEHTYGIAIDTLDNPGWTVDIDLQGTSVDNRPFVSVEIERTDRDWIRAWTVEGKFKAACGPQNLDEILTLFCEWAEIGERDEGL